MTKNMNVFLRNVNLTSEVPVDLRESALDILIERGPVAPDNGEQPIFRTILGTRISNDAYQAIVLFSGKYKIQAIRYLRLLTNLGLKEAKDIVEKIMADNGVVYSF